ncbi:MAG: HlyC/CorC family transporter [Alphaproteobacteria bacterium]|nr:MAG: HlyC/CorC family transporter [Alphaproteobacteria bacterium]
MANISRDFPDGDPSDSEGSRQSIWQKVITHFGRTGNPTSLRESLEEVIEEHQESAKGITEQEQAMLMNILHFGESRVEDVMVPRADIVAVEAGDTLQDLIKNFSDAGHSRVPVFRETLDDPVGMYHIKDLLPLVLEDFADPDQEVKALARCRREVLFVPPSMSSLDLFLKMQATRSHMALVIDEYGGTDGLVTIEDLVEEIVGEIEDEHDAEEGRLIERINDNLLLVDARAEIADLEKELGLKLLDEEEEEDIDTVGGLIVLEVDRVPQRGELITHPTGIEFEIVDADPRRVKRIRIRIRPKSKRSPKTA